MEVKLEDRVIMLPDSISQLPLRNYFGIVDILSKVPELKEDYFSTLQGEIDLYDICDLCIDDSIDDMSLTDIGFVIEGVVKLISNFQIPTAQKTNVIDIDGVTYVSRTLRDMNDLKGGEYISIKMYQEKFNYELAKYAPYILAILIRPGHKELDRSTNQEVWVQEPFDKRSISNIDFRANLFLDRISAEELIPVIGFFLNMKE